MPIASLERRVAEDAAMMAESERKRGGSEKLTRRVMAGLPDSECWDRIGPSFDLRFILPEYGTPLSVLQLHHINIDLCHPPTLSPVIGVADGSLQSPPEVSTFSVLQGACVNAKKPSKNSPVAQSVDVTELPLRTPTCLLPRSNMKQFLLTAWKRKTSRLN